MILTKKELEALKAMAATNLEAALYAAFTRGALRSDKAIAPIKRAAAMLECDAEDIKAAFDGCFDGEAKQDYDERKKVAKALRDICQGAPGE